MDLVDNGHTWFYMSELELAKLNSKLCAHDVPEGPWLLKPFVCQVAYCCVNKKTQVNFVITVQGAAKQFYFSYSESNGLEPDSALRSFFCPPQRDSLLEFLADFGKEKLKPPHHDWFPQRKRCSVATLFLYFNLLYIYYISHINLTCLHFLIISTAPLLHHSTTKKPYKMLIFQHLYGFPLWWVGLDSNQRTLSRPDFLLL